MRLQNEDGINLHDIEYFKNYREKHYKGHSKCPTSLAWNSSGSLLVTAQIMLKLWAFNEDYGLQKLAEVKANQYNIEHAEFSSNNLLGSLSRDSIKFWDVRQNGNIKNHKIERKGKSQFLRFSWNHSDSAGDNCKLAIINKENAVMIYDYRNTSSELKTISPKPNSSAEVMAATWDRSDSVLFVVGGESSNGFITPYNADTFQPISDPLITHCGRITDIDFDRNNERFATASEDSLLQIHCLPEIICERVYSNKNDSSFKRVSFSCDCQYVAASCEGSSIEIYNVLKGGQAYKLKCSQSQQMLSWHPKKIVLAYLDEQDKKRSLGREEDPYVHFFFK